MAFKSINPFNNETIASYDALTEKELEKKLALAEETFKSWRHVSLAERTSLIQRGGQVLRDEKEAYAKMISLEMGKPITESRGEVDKCAWVCDYYAEHAVAFLADEQIVTDAQQSFVKHDPIGTVLAVMPWNFPFWQVFRFAAPTLTAGNTALLKHASNVLACAEMIEDIFHKAGFPKGVFQHLIIGHEHIEQVIAHDTVKAVSLTGSEKAGAAVAEIAGRNLKKSLLELGRSSAFYV